MTLQRSGSPLEPGPSSLVLLPTHQKINGRTVQGERTGAGAQQESGTADSGTDTVVETQGGRGPTVIGEARLLGRLGQVQVSAEWRSDVSAHGFWKRGTTAMFDIRIVNLNTVSYLCMSL